MKYNWHMYSTVHVSKTETDGNWCQWFVWTIFNYY